MNHRSLFVSTVAIALPLFSSSAGCALVLGLGDFSEGGATTGMGSGGSGGSGSGGSGGTAGTGGIGGEGPSCSDGTKNGKETDIDCGGGSICPGCSEGKNCLDNLDCKSSICTMEICQPSSCSDHKQNGAETDIDCGGDTCPSCVTNQKCSNPTDCSSNLCISNICKGHLWSKGFAASDALAVAVDGEGNSIVAGELYGTSDFGGGSAVKVSPDPNSDLYLAKFGPNGKYLWSKQFGSQGKKTIGGLTTDNSGNIIITGQYKGIVDFGGGFLPVAQSTFNLFVAKFNAAGSHLWSANLCDGAGPIPRIAVDAGGNIVIGDSFYGSSTIAGTIINSSNLNDPFEGDTLFVKLKADGTYLWSKGIGAAGDQTLTDLSVDSNGNIFATGFFSKTIDFGGGPIPDTDGNIFLAKLDASGNHLWSKEVGGFNEAGPGRYVNPYIATIANGSTLMVTNIVGAANLGGGSLPSQGAADLVMGMFDQLGAHIWSKRVGAPNAKIHATHPTFDNLDNLLLTGMMSGTVDFGNGPRTSQGFDMFAVKFDQTGVAIWSDRFGDHTAQEGNGIASDQMGNLVIVGHLGDSLAFDGVPLTVPGSDYSSFLAKLAVP